MKEVIFDIKKFSYTSGSGVDLSFVPMLQRRKLNDFGRAGLYTMYGAYCGGNPQIVFASEYGDFDRVVKLISQRQQDGEVSPSGFGSSVHNATAGLFSMLEKINTSYNSISAGEKSLAYGFLESLLVEESLFCYTESAGGVKSVSVTSRHDSDGEYVLSENFDNLPVRDGFYDFIDFLEGRSESFVSDLYMIKRLLK